MYVDVTVLKYCQFDYPIHIGSSCVLQIQASKQKRNNFRQMLAIITYLTVQVSRFYLYIYIHVDG